jgi:ribosomal protein S18 acetylase RimI-like enzyme
MKIKLRKIKKTDWPQMKNLLQEYSDYHRNIFKQTDPSFADFEKGYQQKDFLRMLNKKNKRFLAACDGEKLVGFVLAKISNNKALGNIKQGALSEIFVTKKYRGEGIAELMWQEIFTWLKKEKAQILHLHVLYENKKPQEIYKKWGFKPLGMYMKRKI